MSDGKIEIELRLAMDSLRKQLGEAKAFIQKELSGLTGGSGGERKRRETPGVPDKKEIDTAVSGVKNLSDAMKKASDNAKDIKVTFTQIGKDAARDWTGQAQSTMTLAQRRVAAKPIQKGFRLISQNREAMMRYLEEQEGLKTQREMEAAGVPLQKRVAPSTAKPAAEPTTAPSQASPSPQTTATTLRMSDFGRVLTALTVTATVLRKAFTELRVAADRAAQHYSASLRSGGAPMGLTVQKGVLAGVLGVSTQEVLQYADAIRMVNGRLQESIKAQVQTARLLTATSWGFNILGEDMKALKANTVFMLSPMVNRITGALHNVFEWWTKRSNEQVEASKKAWEEEKKRLLEKRAAIEASVTDKSLRNTLPQWAWASARSNAQRDLAGIDARLAAHKEAPTPAASSYRLSPSTWERMGMVVGQGGGGAAAETAKNTKESAKHLSTIAKKMSGRSTRDLGENWGGAAMNAA